MRRAARIDANQHEIVDVFRALGFSVAITSMVGNGFPDIIIGKFNRNALVEIKDGDKSPSERRLTEDEKEFHGAWQGEIYIMESTDQAIALAVKLNDGWGG